MSTPELSDTPREKKKLPVLNPANAVQRYTWNFSASQIDMWSLCKAKWGFKYIDKIKGQNKFAARGSETHAHLENWLINGVEPDESRYGRLARTGLKHLPLPGEAQIESGYKFISPSGISYLSYLDISFFDKLINLPVVGDHKTTTDFKWAHSPETLAQNTQGVLYSNITFTLWPEYMEAMLRWVYYRDTARPASRKVEAKVEKRDMEAKQYKLDLISEDIAINGLTAKQAKDLPRNALACDQYGGCPYREICGVTDAEYLGARMTQLSIRDRLMNGVAKTEEIKKAESVQQQTPPENSNPTVLSALDRMRQRAAEAAQGKAASTTQAAPSSQTRSEDVSVQTEQLPASQTVQTTSAVDDEVKTVQTAPTNTVQKAAPAAGGSLLARLKNKTGTPATSTSGTTQTSAPVGATTGTLDKTSATASAPATSTKTSQTRSEDVSVQTQQLPASQTVQTTSAVDDEVKTVQTESAVTEDSVFSASDINPPEAPTGDQIVDDPEVLAAQVESGKPAKNKAATVAVPEDKPKRGRPVGSTTTKVLSDEGYIFARVFAEVCRESRGDLAMASACATAAVKAFRELD